MFTAGARRAVLAIVLSLAAFAASSGLIYRRQVRLTLESERDRPAFSSIRAGLSALFRRAALRTPEERAIYPFFSKTLRGDAKHRTTMAYYLAGAAGVVMLFLISQRRGLSRLTPSNAALLAQPLIVGLVVLAGLRTLANVPASPGARWVFEATDTGRTGRYAAAVKKAVFFRWLVPLAALVFALHLALWGAAAAAAHAVFFLALSGLGLEAFFLRYRKVPFACTHVPGKFRFHVWFVPLVLAFFVSMSAATALERWLLVSPARFAGFLAAVLIAWAVLAARNRRFYRGASLVFEEEPEPVMLTLTDRS